MPRIRYKWVVPDMIRLLSLDSLQTLKMYQGKQLVKPNTFYQVFLDVIDELICRRHGLYRNYQEKDQSSP